MLVITAGPLSAQGESALTRPFDSSARFYGVLVSSAPHGLEPWLPGRRDRACPAAEGPSGGAIPASDNPVQPPGHPDHSQGWCQGCFGLSGYSPAWSRRPCLRRCSPFKAALWVSFLFSLSFFFSPQVPRAGDSASGFIQKSLRVSDPHEASQCLDLLE